MKKYFLLTSAVCFFSVISAQFNNSINTSSWGGISNVTWNPSIADGRYVADVSLGTINSGFIQNHIGAQPKSVFYNVNFDEIFKFTMLNNEQWQAGDFLKSSLGKSDLRSINQFAQLEGPGSFMVPFSKGINTIAVSWHLNAARTIREMSPGFAEWSSKTNNTSEISAFNLSLTQATWADYGVTYSRVCYDKGEHFIKAGATLKLLQSFGTGTVYSSGFTYSLTSDSTILVNNGVADVSYNSGSRFSAAADLGIVYEWRPKKDNYRYDMDSSTGILPQFKDVYTLAAGFAIIDIGALSTKGGSIFSRYDLAGKSFSSSDFNVFNTPAIANAIGSSGAGKEYAGSKNIWLPTRFNLYLDYNIAKGFKLNLNSSLSPYFNSSKSQVTYGSYVSIVPRFDLPMVGVYMPLTFHFNNPVPSLGVSVRAGPVWFGISDFIGLGMPKGASNITFFGGVKIPIYYHKPSDKDGDKVSKKFDLCPFEVGTWASRGCIDRDGDGVRDSVDECPDVKGLVEFKGCPDTDGDGVEDRYDDCPDVKGLVQFKGCPDSDHDGVPDKIDRCPHDAGPAYLLGCPDADGDSIPDIDDSCKISKGSPLHHGCPDTDGDGLYDYEDDDIYTPGPRENHGKPWEDSDGDGIYDNEDKCPTTPGKAEFGGCPTPPKHNRITAGESSYDTLFFEIRQAEITQRYEKVLKKFADRMNQDDQLNNTIKLIGHTDKTETEDFNKESLSLDRAASAREKLVAFGIDSKRIETEGLGDTQPLNSNSTPTERKKNRRVEIKIVVVPE